MVFTKIFSDCSTAKTGSAASTPARVTEEDLAQFLAVLSQDDSGVGGPWEDVIEKQSESVSYNAKRRDPKVCIHPHLDCHYFLFPPQHFGMEIS